MLFVVCHDVRRLIATHLQTLVGSLFHKYVTAGTNSAGIFYSPLISFKIRSSLG